MNIPTVSWRSPVLGRQVINELSKALCKWKQVDVTWVWSLLSNTVIHCVIRYWCIKDKTLETQSGVEKPLSNLPQINQIQWRDESTYHSNLDFKVICATGQNINIIAWLCECETGACAIWPLWCPARLCWLYLVSVISFAPFSLPIT